MKNLTIQTFADKLASGQPTPGGGGASGLTGALAACLTSMVANLSVGKKKFADMQDEIQTYIERANILKDKLLNNIQEDEDAFIPLSKAYTLDKEDPHRDEQLESCLKLAAKSPTTIFNNIIEVVQLIQEVQTISTKLAISDVACAASLAYCSLQCAAVNVYVNTRLMKDKTYANELNNDINNKLHKYLPIVQEIYDTISTELSND